MKHLLPVLLLVLAPTAASAAFIDFDDQNPPCTFSSQSQVLSNEYAGQGITFNGNMEVLDQCGSFNVSGYSPPNFLAWNTSWTSTTEYLNFSSGAYSVSFRAGCRYSNGYVTARAYSGTNGGGSLLETQYVSLSSSSLQTVSFSASGIRSVKIDVQGYSGVIDDISFQLNQSPTANAGGPYQGSVGQGISLNGSGSFDSDGSITNYAWDCTANGSYDTSSSSPTNSSCTYSSPGTYTVRLRVTDNAGATATDTATVTITNQAPVAEANGPYSGGIGSPIQLNGNGSYDPDGSISLYQWDCTANGSYDTSSGSPTGASCTYSSPGQFTVRLRVTDNNGSQSTDTASVTITNAPPVADAGGPYTVGQLSPLTPSGSGSYDPDGSISLYEWDCTNDGSYDTSSGSPNGASCTYPDDGNYVIRLRVTDNNGSTATDTANVTATNSGPTANAGGPYTQNQAQAVALDGSSSFDSDGTLVLYEWDCTNDGSYDVGSPSPTGSTCSYQGVGSYTVRIRVTDDDGATATDIGSVTITNLPPTADAGGPYSIAQGDPLPLDGTGSSDPDGTIVSWAWDCTNDGFDDVVGTAPQGSTCTYPAQGTFTLSLVVTDSDGATASDTTTVTVTNALPIADPGGPYTVNQGVTQPLNGGGSYDPDGSIVQYRWDCENDGVFEITSANPTGDSCVWADDGTYTLALEVTDDDGDVVLGTVPVVVTNTLPVAEAGGPYQGTKNNPVAVDGSQSSDSDGAIVLYEWDCADDGAFELSSASPTEACTYTGVGTFTIALRVTDDDGGLATDTTTVVVGNDPPVADAGGPYTGVEEGSVSVDASASVDPSGALVLYEWDCADDGVFELAGPTPFATCVYPDDGTWTVAVRVTDDDGATATATELVVISNVDPVITSFVTMSGAEGDTLTFSSSGTDVQADPLTATWDWGDGTTDVGSAPTHTYADDGTYTVTLTLDDGDGGTATMTDTVVVTNVAPVFTSNPPVNALEGSLYSYQPVVLDPGAEVFVWTLSASAPAGMTIDPVTGLIEWTPTYDQSLVGTFAVTLTVDDGDGGTDVHSWTITVLSADSDGDGLPDSWEIDNGLDPNDPSDAAGDPDGDGLTNLDEFGQGTDPNVYDGPTLPTAYAPLTGDEVDSERPDLIVTNATDPQNDVLVYEFELYADAGLTTLVTASPGVLEDASGLTSWKVDLPLTENTTFWWRARVSDPFVTTAWTPEESFFVNVTNEHGEPPVLVYPTDDQTVTTTTPELVWTEAIDPDGDALTYDVEVFDANGALVDSATGVVGDGSEGTWTLTTALAEDAWYSWTARAVDEHGLIGPWAQEEGFFLSTANEAPFGVAFIEPQDGEELATASPILVATEGVDPEGTTLEYVFDLDSTPAFEGADAITTTLPATGTGQVEWALALDGIELPANTLVYARVQAVDADGIASVPDVISFFVRGDNDPPNVPVLVAPADGSEGGVAPVLEVEDPVDPEDDVVLVEFIVASDAELTEILAWNEGGVLVTGDGTTTWEPAIAITGTVWWSARALDNRGGVSDWAAPWTYHAEDGGHGDDDDSAAEDPEGCKDCNNSMSGGAASLWWLIVLAPIAWRRRR